MLLTAPSPSMATPQPSHIRPGSISSQNGDIGYHMSTHSQSGQSGLDTAPQHQQSWVVRPDAGYRKKVAETLLRINSHFETAAPDRFDDSFKHGKALDFPEVPGEDYRNPALWQTRRQYNRNREAENEMLDLSRQISQVGSFAGSVASGSGGEGGSAARAAGSSRKSQSGHSTSPMLERGHQGGIVRKVDTNTSEQEARSSISDAPRASGLRPRRDTLEVPK